MSRAAKDIGPVVQYNSGLEHPAFTLCSSWPNPRRSSADPFNTKNREYIYCLWRGQHMGRTAHDGRLSDQDRPHWHIDTDSWLAALTWLKPHITTWWYQTIQYGHVHEDIHKEFQNSQSKADLHVKFMIFHWSTLSDHISFLDGASRMKAHLFGCSNHRPYLLAFRESVFGDTRIEYASVIKFPQVPRKSNQL